MTFWSSTPPWLKLSTGIYLVLWLVAALLRACDLGPEWLMLAVLLPSLPLGMAWIAQLRRREPNSLAWSLLGSILFIAWGRLLVEATSLLGLASFASGLDSALQLGVFLIGLLWVVWGLEKGSRRIELARIDATLAQEPVSTVSAAEKAAAHARAQRSWNPLDPQAWYYGRQGQKLKQSTLALVSYTLAFYFAMLLLSLRGGCAIDNELPAGGGKQQAVAQKVRIQKVIRKKFVINPFSAIKFEVPPIDEVKLQLQEVTAHQYQIGQGEGEGAGYSSGKGSGKMGLYRLEYDGGDWDLNHGIGGDFNMLLQYNLLTGQKVEEKAGSVRPTQILRKWTAEKSVPLIFVTGQKNLSLAANETKALREYLIDRHGMIFASSGSQHFHNQFMAAMNRILPEIRPVSVPLDDQIHRIPFSVPTLPYVVPHGGKDALGWSMDGRWLVYYHPGDISDAWADGHSGVPPEIYNSCYQLGANVMNYAAVQANQWREARKKGS